VEVLPKSPAGRDVRYTLKNWTALTRYCEDGDLEIDNNATERCDPGYRRRSQQCARQHCHLNLLFLGLVHPIDTRGLGGLDLQTVLLRRDGQEAAHAAPYADIGIKGTVCGASCPLLPRSISSKSLPAADLQPVRLCRGRAGMDSARL
jgi:Transposase IS66 family